MISDDVASDEDPFADVHRHEEQRRFVRIGLVAIAVVAALAVLTLRGTFDAPTVAGTSQPGGPSASQTSDPSTPQPSPSISTPTTPPTPLATPVPLAAGQPTPAAFPSGYVRAWGRIYVRDSAGAARDASPQVGDCVRSSDTWEWSGVAYDRVPCAYGFRVVALTRFSDGDPGSAAAAATRFETLETLVWSSCFALYATGTPVSDNRYFDTSSNLMHWDYSTDEGTWVVEPAPGELICLEFTP